jgi:hypothetical protein
MTVRQGFLNRGLRIEINEPFVFVPARRRVPQSTDVIQPTENAWDRGQCPRRKVFNHAPAFPKRVQ